MKYFDTLNKEGNKLNSMDFVKEMLEIIRSKSIDWKDVNYNYLNYLDEYDDFKKEEHQPSEPSKEQ